LVHQYSWEVWRKSKTSEIELKRSTALFDDTESDDSWPMPQPTLNLVSLVNDRAISNLGAHASIFAPSIHNFRTRITRSQCSSVSNECPSQVSSPNHMQYNPRRHPNHKHKNSACTNQTKIGLPVSPRLPSTHLFEVVFAPALSLFTNKTTIVTIHAVQSRNAKRHRKPHLTSIFRLTVVTIGSSTSS
jgi:hypothetical protein